MVCRRPCAKAGTDVVAVGEAEELEAVYQPAPEAHRAHPGSSQPAHLRHHTLHRACLAISAALLRMPRGPQAAADRRRLAKPHRAVRRGIVHAKGGMGAVAVLAMVSHGSGARVESRVPLE